MCWEGQSKFPGLSVTGQWMSVLSGRAWSFSCFVNVWFFSQPCCLSPPLPPTPTWSLNSSWTEDTRSCIFSDTTLHFGKDGQTSLVAELDMQIEQKFEEFDELAATGKNLLDKEHHLTQMVSRVSHVTFFEYIFVFIWFYFTNSNVLQVRERMEELRSMLGWILVHWRAQKQQWLHKKSRQEPSQDNIYFEATMGPPSTEVNEQRDTYCRDRMSEWRLGRTI